MAPQDFHRLLVDSAQAEGFPIAGALDLDLAKEAMAPHIASYDQWLAQGHAGAMSYLERGRDRRADPQLVFPEAQSVFCVALPYPKRAGGAESIAQGPRYARYIHGRDYHETIAEKLERVMQKVKADWQSPAGNPPLKWKVCVDTSAVLERSWAVQAGLGWIGKNTLLIHPIHGSYLLLGEVLINQRTGLGPRPLPDYCGNCTRCMKSCPTGAIERPHLLNSRRCISYWTLEKRGPLDLPEEDLHSINGWIAGCDLCQEVCPFNFKPVKQELAHPALDAAPSPEHPHDWLTLLLEDEASYKARVKESALSRVKPAQFRRNLAITLTNAHELLEPQVRAQLQPLIEARLQAETDEAARAQWDRCLKVFQAPNRKP
jgi:epoxyqueuosine reductase